LLRRQPRVILIVSGVAGRPPTPPENMLALDGVFAPKCAVSSRIRVRWLDSTDIAVSRAPNPRGLNFGGIEFSLRLSKMIVNEVKDSAVVRFSTAESVPPESIFQRYSVPNDVRPITFNRMVFDSLTEFATAAALSLFLDDRQEVNIEYIVDHLASRDRFLYRGFRLSPPQLRLLDADAYQRSALDARVRFVLDAWQSSKSDHLSSFLRGLGYFARSLEYGPRDQSGRIVWAVAAIEALLTVRQERGSTELLASRLSAALSDKDGAVRGSFRKLYAFRSDFLHGNLDIPVIIADDHFMPSSPVKPGLALGENDLAITATTFCRQLLRKMIDQQRTEFRFRTELLE